MTEPTRNEWTRLDDVRLPRVNAKLHDLDELTRAILSVGFTTLPQVDERTGVLVWGAGRVTALRRLRDRGAEAPKGVRDVGDDWEVEVRRGWSSRDDAHAAAVREGENRVGEGGYDDRVLYEVLAEVAESNPAYLGGTGWGAAALDDLADRFGEDDGAEHVAFVAATETTTPGWDDPYELPDPTTGSPWGDRARPPADAGPGSVVDPGPVFRPVGDRPPPGPRGPVREDPPPAEHRALPRDDGPGPAGKTKPRWRLLQPYAAAFHRGGRAGADELVAWLAEHGHEARVAGEHDVAVEVDPVPEEDDDGLYVAPRNWVTIDGQTDECEAWSEDDFLGRFVPANEPARRVQHAAETSPPDPGGAAPRGEP